MFIKINNALTPRIIDFNQNDLTKSFTLELKPAAQTMSIAFSVIFLLIAVILLGASMYSVINIIASKSLSVSDFLITLVALIILLFPIYIFTKNLAAPAIIFSKNGEIILKHFFPFGIDKIQKEFANLKIVDGPLGIQLIQCKFPKWIFSRRFNLQMYTRQS